MTYFAYVHARPETVNQSGIFYVGKGKNGRSHDLNERNRYHGFIIDKHGKENILIGKMDCSTEEIAFELEKGLIKCLRRSGVELTNQTDGGDGASGFKQSEETRRKKSVASKALNARPEVKQAKSKATTKLNYERWADPIWAAKVSAAMTGKKKTRTEASDAARRINVQKASTPEANAKKSAKSLEMWADPEFKAKMSVIQSAAQKATPMTDKKLNAALSNAVKAKLALQDPVKKEAARLKNSEASKRMWAERKRKSLSNIKE